MSAVGAAQGLAWRLWAAAPPTPGVPSPGNPPGSERGEEFGKTSPIALVVILLLGLATVLLIRSMSKRLKNVPASFDETPDPDGGRGVGRTEQSGLGPPAERVDPADDERRSGPRAGPTGSP